MNKVKQCNIQENCVCKINGIVCNLEKYSLNNYIWHGMNSINIFDTGEDLQIAIYSKKWFEGFVRIR